MLTCSQPKCKLVPVPMGVHVFSCTPIGTGTNLHFGCRALVELFSLGIVCVRELCYNVGSVPSQKGVDNSLVLPV